MELMHLVQLQCTSWTKLQLRDKNKTEKYTTTEIIIDNKVGRVDVWLGKELDLSRNKIQSLIKNGYILLNDASPKVSCKPRVGDRLSITIPPPPQTELLPQDLPLDIIHMDSEVIIINKAAGMVVVLITILIVCLIVRDK